MRDDGCIDPKELLDLHAFHIEHCSDYARILDAIYPMWSDAKHVDEIPPLPVRFFKEYDLQSNVGDQELKLMVSSGTSGVRSRIFLSRANAIVQQKALMSLGKQILGSQRMPMLIMDDASVVDHTQSFSARAAGINGFKLFSKKSSFVSDRSGVIDRAVLKQFTNFEKFFAFGFTWVMWRILNELNNLNLRFPDHSNVTVIHGGGWKKLEGTGVSKEAFQRLATRVFGLKTRVVDYYGMIEQTGSIYFECSGGYFHDTKYGSVVIRHQETMQSLTKGELGLIQVNSVLPTSYPGHSLLTEDLGRRWVGRCECGSRSPRFQVVGRLKMVDIRGCSDAI